MKSFQHLSDSELLSLAREAMRLPEVPEALVRSVIEMWPAPAATASAAATAATAVVGASPAGKPVGTLPCQPAREPSLADDLLDTAQAAFRWVSASLSFDSWATPALAMGMRGSATDTRHLLFCAEGCDIDLRITPTADCYAVAGQILGSTESGQVEFAATEVGVRGIFSGARIAPLDDMGEFHLDGLSAGTYRLTLKVGRDKIALPPIDIGARQRRA